MRMQLHAMQEFCGSHRLCEAGHARGHGRKLHGAGLSMAGVDNGLLGWADSGREVVSARLPLEVTRHLSSRQLLPVGYYPCSVCLLQKSILDKGRASTK